jgi:hypothetical protein
LVDPSQLYCLPPHSSPAFEYILNSEENRVRAVTSSPAPMVSGVVTDTVGAPLTLITLSPAPTSTAHCTFILGLYVTLLPVIVATLGV